VLISVRDVRIWRIVDVFSGAAVIAYGVSGLERTVEGTDLLLFLAMLLVGAITIYCFWLVIATLAFWIVAAWNIIELFQGVYQTGRWPVSVYPIWLRLSVTFLVPIAFAITVPAEALTSRLDWQTIVLALGFCVALFAFTRWWWRFGLRHYTGASA
jgi:ABC-2 type transport system permease protein